MSSHGLKVFDQKILVIGPIYDKIGEISQNNWISDHDLIIFNGNLTYPYKDLSTVKERIKIMDNYLQSGKVIYNLGNQDLILMKKLWETGETSDIYHWLHGRSNAVMIDFAKTQSNLVITGGGVTSKMRRSDLQDNLEISFVSRLEGRPWHDLYGGSCGYVIANNPLTQDKPRHYNFSTQIGNFYSPNANVYAIQVSYNGLGKIFCL